MKNSIVARMPLTIGFATLTIVVGGFCAYRAALFKGPFSVEVATWIQAAGAILAILAGFAAGREQAATIALDRHTAEELDDRKAHSLALSLAKIAVKACDDVLGRMTTAQPLNGAAVQKAKRYVENRRSTLGLVPVASLRNYELMEGLAPLGGILDYVGDKLREIADTTSGGKIADPATTTIAIGRIGELAQEAKDCLKRIEEIGG